MMMLQLANNDVRQQINVMITVMPATRRTYIISQDNLATQHTTHLSTSDEVHFTTEGSITVINQSKKSIQNGQISSFFITEHVSYHLPHHCRALTNSRTALATAHLLWTI